MHFEKMAASEAAVVKQRAITEGWISANGSQFVREWEKRILDTQLTVETSILPALRQAHPLPAAGLPAAAAAAPVPPPPATPVPPPPAAAPVPPPPPPPPPRTVPKFDPPPPPPIYGAPIIVPKFEPAVAKVQAATLADLFLQQHCNGAGCDDTFITSLEVAAAGDPMRAAAYVYNASYLVEQRMWLPVAPKAIDSLLQLLEAAYSALTARLGVAPDNLNQPDSSVDLTGSSDEGPEPPAKQRRLGLTQVELAAKREAVDAAEATRRLEELESKVVGHAGRAKVETSTRLIRELFKDIFEAQSWVQGVSKRYQLLTGSISVESRKSTILGHLTQVTQMLKQSPNRTLPTDGTGPTGTFTAVFVPEYEAGLAAGMSETASKTLPSVAGGIAPPEAFLASILAGSAAMRGVAKHQKDRAEAKAAHAAANAPHVKYTPERIYATQVEPRSRQRQRILVGWQGHPQTKIDAKELTWQAVSDFERPVGPFRAYEVLLLDPFVSAVAASPDGSTRGWPFKKVGNGNDKYVWIHPSTPAALATYIRTHPTTTMQTGYD